MKTAEEVTKIIMKALNMEDAPEAILVEPFLAKWERDIRNDEAQNPTVIDEGLPTHIEGYVVDWKTGTMSVPYDLADSEYKKLKEICHQHKIRIQLSV